MMRDYIDNKTALELNPYIMQEQIDEILGATDNEQIGITER